MPKTYGEVSPYPCNPLPLSPQCPATRARPIAGSLANDKGATLHGDKQVKVRHCLPHPNSQYQGHRLRGPVTKSNLDLHNAWRCHPLHSAMLLHFRRDPHPLPLTVAIAIPYNGLHHCLSLRNQHT